MKTKYIVPFVAAIFSTSAVITAVFSSSLDSLRMVANEVNPYSLVFASSNKISSHTGTYSEESSTIRTTNNNELTIIKKIDKNNNNDKNKIDKKEDEENNNIQKEKENENTNQNIIIQDLEINKEENKVENEKDLNNLVNENIIKTYEEKKSQSIENFSIKNCDLYNVGTCRKKRNFGYKFSAYFVNCKTVIVIQSRIFPLIYKPASRILFNFCTVTIL